MKLDASGVILLDSIEWPRVTSATYRIEQRFRYAYPGPIANLRHRLVVSPPSRHGTQRRLSRKLTLAPALPAERVVDAFGNEIVTLAVPRVEEAFDVGFDSLVVNARVGERAFDGALRHADPALHLETHLTACDDAMRECAYEHVRDHRDPLERANALSSYVYARIAYTKGVTDVATTAVQAFHKRRGVCQDFAHVFLGLARAAGLAARYVSGHLLGEGGTHAWAEVLLPQDDGTTTVVALDPTHDRVATISYVTIAVGRDYADVAPTSGAYDGPYLGTLEARHVVSATEIVYA